MQALGGRGKIGILGTVQQWKYDGVIEGDARARLKKKVYKSSRISGLIKVYTEQTNSRDIMKRWAMLQPAEANCEEPANSNEIIDIARMHDPGAMGLDAAAFIAMRIVEKEKEARRDEDILLKYASELELSLREHPADGDGHCMLRAAALQTDAGEEDHRELRKRVVDEVTSKSERYLDCFLGCDQEASLRRWAQRMRRNDWGDNIAMLAICNIVLRPALIYRKGTDQIPLVLRPEGYISKMQLNPLFFISDETRAGCEHYNALVIGKRGADARPSDCHDDAVAYDANHEEDEENHVDDGKLDHIGAHVHSNV